MTKLALDQWFAIYVPDKGWLTISYRTPPGWYGVMAAAEGLTLKSSDYVREVSFNSRPHMYAYSEELENELRDLKISSDQIYILAPVPI